MKRKKIFLTIFCLSFLLSAFAQWPGNFYAFVLKDAAGNIIRPGDTTYRMMVIDKDPGMVLSIKICKDDSTWRFYEGGNHYMGSTQKLKITRNKNAKISENMIVEFPPSFSKGKEQYYRKFVCRRFEV